MSVRRNAFAEDVNRSVSADPVTQALLAPLEEAVRNVLAGHLPKLVLTRGEAAEVLGCSVSAIDVLLAEGRLDRIAAGKITLASVLRLAGWPIAPAPVGAPLTSVPAVEPVDAA